MLKFVEKTTPKIHTYINVSENDVVMHFGILWSFTQIPNTTPPTVNIDDLTHSGKQAKKLFIPT